MKVAVVGQGICALEMVIELWSLGASVTWYNPLNSNSFFIQDALTLSWQELASSQGLEILNQLGRPKLNLNHNPTRAEFEAQYFNVLYDYFNNLKVIKSQKVARISKRYLMPAEKPSNTSRFVDLFRVVSLFDPKGVMMKEENKVVYEKMGTELLHSLQDPFEVYDDFDVVIEANPNLMKKNMGTGTYAIGEKKFEPEIYYAREESFYTPNSNVAEVALIGSGDLASLQLQQLEKWLLENKSHRLFVISTDAAPFKNKNSKLLKTFSDDHEVQMVKYEKDLDLWNQEEDYIKVKLKEPVLPIPQIVFFSGHNVTAVDKLMNESRFFLTCEKPEFRQSLVQPENAQLDLKTISVDKIVVALKSQKDLSIYFGLDLKWDNFLSDSISIDGGHPEIGFFSFPILTWNENDIKIMKQRTQSILNQLKQLFTKAI